MRTKQHYIDLLDKNPNTTVGFTLAAQAVYAAKNGSFDSDTGDNAYRKIARSLKQKYGENLTVEQVKTEMEGQPEMKQFPVILPADMHETVRRISFDRKISMAEIVREAVREWIEKEGI